MADPYGIPVWALTGPIGGGKSLAADAFAAGGAVVIDADREGHGVLADPSVRSELRQAFGDDVFCGEEVDRPVLGRLVFGDADALARLDAITHPRLSARLVARLRDAASRDPLPPLAVVEAAVYFRLPPFAAVDRVICVTAPEEVRIERLAASGRLSADDARARVEAQRPLLRDWERSDIVLVNDGTPDDLRRAVQDLLNDPAQRGRDATP